MTELEKATSVYVDNKRLHFWNDVRKSGCFVFPECVFNDKDLEEAFMAGAKWQYEQFEKERLKHCDELTTEQAQIESDFVVQHLKNFNRTPTFIDAIEYGKRLQKERLIPYTADAMIGLPYENKDGGYTHLVDVSRPLPVGNNKIAIIFKEEQK